MAHLHSVPDLPDPERIPDYIVTVHDPKKVDRAHDALIYWGTLNAPRTGPFRVHDCPEDTIHEALSAEGVYWGEGDYSVEEAAP